MGDAGRASCDVRPRHTHSQFRRVKNLNSKSVGLSPLSDVHFAAAAAAEDPSRREQTVRTLNGTLLTWRIGFLGLIKSLCDSCLTGLRLYRSCVGESSPRSRPPDGSERAIRFRLGDVKLNSGFAEPGDRPGEVMAVYCEVRAEEGDRRSGMLSIEEGPNSSDRNSESKVLFASSVPVGSCQHARSSPARKIDQGQRRAWAV